MGFVQMYICSLMYTFYFYSHAGTEISCGFHLAHTFLLLQPAVVVFSMRSEVRIGC